MNIKKFGKELTRHFQSGVSYMIPLVTAAGLLTSLAVIFGGQEVWDTTETFWGVVRMIGQTGLGFIVPMISGYIAYSISDRPGLAPGFVTGIVANEMGAGFIGGMVTGILTGYLVNLLKKMPISPKVQTLKSIIIIPFITTAVVGLAMWYVIGVPITAMTEGLTNWLNGMSGANATFLGALLGAMMAFDMGGPINKIAYAFGTASFASGSYAASTAMLLGIGIPPLVMFIATLLNKNLYSDAERDNGKTAMIMGLVGITEGTIPFAVADPLAVIPSIVVGTAVSGGINAFFGVTHQTMLSTFMAIPFTSNAIIYVISILIGGVVGALMVNVIKDLKKRRKEETTELQGEDNR
ncbi:PTS fructose transporter subunit IIC [Pisciglobus halotolerans]|uniref:PTS system, fructose-specific IIC component n=1 Tax=Pisciglobus halotolerans TaxID=745365 RepID=A0A1I3B0P8_9LACT|nr:PTS fructose transporter subunit IIC [Pisciglobus halotolerans]SFH55241.1 PTS system, fructose-specific IIC component [Pisciglobus halotolerans]